MVIFTYIANLTNIHLLWKNLTPPKSEIYEEKEHSPASIPTPLPTHFTCYRLEVVAAALEGNLYYGKTKGPRKSRLLPWQPSAFLEQWEKGEARKRQITLLFAEILAQDGTFCLTRAEYVVDNGELVGSSLAQNPKWILPHFLRWEWTEPIRGEEQKESKGKSVNCVQVLGVGMGHMEAEEADTLSLAVERM